MCIYPSQEASFICSRKLKITHDIIGGKEIRRGKVAKLEEKMIFAVVFDT
jgi:hypothetical protein